MTLRTEGVILNAPAVAGPDTRDDMPVAFNAELGGGWQRFATQAERDIWAAQYKSRLMGTTAFIEAGWYKWTGTQPDGSDGAWQAIDPVSNPGTGTDLTQLTGRVAVVETGLAAQGQQVAALETDDAQNKQDVARVKADIATKISGIHVEDAHNHAHDGAVALHFIGATTSDDGNGHVTVAIDAVTGKAQQDGFFAYLSGDVVLTDNEKQSDYRIAPLFCDDIMVSSQGAIIPDKASKSYDVEFVGDILCVIKLSMAGFAPDDGSVMVSLNDLTKSGVVTDTNGDMVSGRRHYKKGDLLGDVLVYAIFQNLQPTELKPVVSFKFNNSNGPLVSADRVQSGTCFLLQTMSDTGDTGDALQQFEIDSGQTFQYSTYNLGEVAGLGYVVYQDTPVQSGPAGGGETLMDGWFFNPLTKMKFGIDNANLVFQNSDDGTPCSFTFGKVLSNEVYSLMKGKSARIVLGMKNPLSDFYVRVAVWKGNPDEYSTEFATALVGGLPTLKAGWELYGNPFDFTSSGSDPTGETAAVLTMPTEGNNVAFFMMPVDQTAVDIQMAEFLVGLDPAETRTVIHGTYSAHEHHYKLRTDYVELINNINERYTISTSAEGLPMPCGVVAKGQGPVTIDNTVNIVSHTPATAAVKGEGAIKFGAIGEASISTELWLSNDSMENSTVIFWYSYVSDDGNTFTNIPKSEGVFQIDSGIQYTSFMMPTFDLMVKPGMRIALRAKSDKMNGAFLGWSWNKPYSLQSTITYKEMIPSQFNDPLTGIDMQQFDRVYSHTLHVSKNIKNVASLEIPMVIPSGYDIAVLDCVKMSADGVIRPVTKLDYSYDPKKNIMSVSFGETVVNGMITMGIYL